MTKEEFVEDLTIMFSRSKTGEVIAYWREEDIGNEDPKTWASIMVKAFSDLCVDDSDDPVTREDGTSHTPLYQLKEIDTWKPGLFEKLSNLIWWIPKGEEINTLDVLAGIKE